MSTIPSPGTPAPIHSRVSGTYVVTSLADSSGSSNTFHRVLRRALLAISAAALLGGQSADAATGPDTWTGATNQTWNTAGNWAGTNKPPATGDTIFFASGTGSGTLTDNLTTPGTITFASVIFNAGAASFTINPNAIATNGFTLLSGTVANNGTNLETINDNIALTGANDTVFTTAGGGNVTLGGTLSSGSSSLTIIGSGLTMLTAANTYTGATKVSSGTLELNFGQTPFSGNAVTSNIVSSSSAFTLGSANMNGTVLLINGSSGVTLSQTFASTTFTGGSQLDVNQNGATSINVSLGALARSAAATTDFVIPTSGTGTINTTSTTFAANSILVSAATNGIAYATANNGTTWATNTAGVIGALSTYGTSYTATTNVDVGSADAASGFTVNTLRFNGATSTLTASGSNIIGTGGILVTANATNAILTGGTIGGGGGKELVIIDNGAINISSALANSTSGASAATFAGSGTTTLSGVNTYTGVTTVNGKELIVTGTLGATSIGVNAGATLTASSANGIGSSAITVLESGTVNETMANAFTGSTSFSLGSAGSGAGNVILSASNNFTGSVSLGNNGGNELTLSDPNAIASASSFTVTAGTVNLLSNTAVTFNTPGIGFTAITINVGNLGSGSGNMLAISGTLTAASNGRTLNVTGSNGYSLSIGGFGVAAGADTLNPTTASLTVENIVNANTSGTDTVFLSGTAVGNVISGSINNGTGTAITAIVENGGVWTLSGSSSYTGVTTLTSGTLVVANTHGLGASSVSMGGGVLDLATDTSIAPYNVTGTSSITILSDKATPSSAGITQTLGTLSIGAFTVNTAAGVNVSGGAPVVAFGATTLNSTTGATTVFNPTTANVTLASVTSLAASTKVNTLQLDGTSTGNQITGTIDNGATSGTTALIKSNISTWILSGANTYSGGTVISNGNLEVANSTGSATGTGTVVLTSSSAGAHATLSGNGIISGLVTTTGTGAAIGAAHLAPGLGATPGTLTLGNGLTIGNGTNLDYDLGSTSSLLAVTGNLSLGGNIVLNATGIAGFGLNTVYDLINFSGTLLNSGSLSSWTASSLPGGATGYSFAVVSGTEITVTFTGSAAVVPTVAYWQGGLSGTWATVTSGSTNFTSDAAGTTNTGAIPGAATNVKFTANSAGNLNTVLGQDFTINSLEFTGTGSTAATTSVTIGGTNTLTIMAGGTNGNTAGNGITVDAGSAAHTISSNVALGSSQTWTVSGSALTVSGNVSSGGNAYGLTKSGTGTLILSGSDSYSGTTAVNAGALEVDGSLSGSSAVTVGVATLSGTGNIGGNVALTGTSNLSSAGTLTVASLGVSGGGNTISSGTVNATGGTTINSGGNLAVNSTLAGSVGVSGVLSGTGKLTGAVTVSAGGVTSPGVGSAPGVLTSDLAYSASSTANFNVASGSSAAPQANLSKLYYSQMIVTGGSGAVSLAIGNNVTLGANSATSIAQTGSQIQGDGSSNSGVTLQLSLSSADYATLLANKSTNYNARSGNTGLDNYFVFNLGTTLSTGRFTALDIDVTGGTNASGTIYYSGTNDRFATDGVGNTIGDVFVNGQEYALSYTGNFGSNSTIGGDDIVLTAIPEPGTWGVILGGFGMLVGFQRFRKRRSV